MEFTIVYFTAINGKAYARIFLDELELENEDLWKITLGFIKSLKNKQYHVLPYSKSLGAGLFELRSRSGKHTCRINYCFGKGQKIFLLNGFVKNDKKTQQREIMKARKLMMECKAKDA